MRHAENLRRALLQNAIYVLSRNPINVLCEKLSIYINVVRQKRVTKQVSCIYK